MINWKLRFQNKTTLWAIICLVVSMVYKILDACGVIPAFDQDFILDIADNLLTLLGLLGVIVDPTTDGVGDSKRALTYEQPWNDEYDYDG